MKILLKIVLLSGKLPEQKKWDSGTPERFLNGKSRILEHQKGS
jgi:hypothetical protein